MKLKKPTAALYRLLSDSSESARYVRGDSHHHHITSSSTAAVSTSTTTTTSTTAFVSTTTTTLNNNNNGKLLSPASASAALGNSDRRFGSGPNLSSATMPLFQKPRNSAVVAQQDQKRHNTTTTTIVETYQRDKMSLKSFGGVGGQYGLPNCSSSGLDRLKSNRLNKELAFGIEERQALGILGLIPPAVQSQELQVKRCVENLNRLPDNLDKYIYLYNLQENNEKLFYRVLQENVKDLMPIVYTPVVGLACQRFSHIYNRPRGLFISIHDKGHVYDVLRNWPEQDVRVIVVTDGGRILGLGDLGANGMGIPIGKLSLYTALAGVSPQYCLPITLDVGTNTQSILDDPFYIGLKQKRADGKEYDDFVEEFMQAVVRRFGHNTLIQFEDFGNAYAFKFLEKYRDSYCTFNDDIQGTASVAVAGLLAALKITKNKLSDNVFVFQGAGSASLGIAGLCVMAMMKEGTSEQDAKDKIWLVDSRGLVVQNRPEGGVDRQKLLYARKHAPVKTLTEVVKKAKPTFLIGASAQGGTFTPEILQEMGKNNKRPVIFALSNPTDKAECTAEAAYKNTEGRALFVSGSPFPSYVHHGKTLIPGQGNNAYIFPGVGLGAITAGLKTITEETFLVAAQTLAEMVTEKELAQSSLYVGLDQILNCSINIAVKIVEDAYKSGHATTFPEPKNKLQFVKDQMYKTAYTKSLPPIYTYPKI